MQLQIIQISKKIKQENKKRPNPSYWPKKYSEKIEITIKGFIVIRAPEEIKWAVGRDYRNVLFQLLRNDGVITSVKNVNINNIKNDPKVSAWLNWINKRNGQKNTT